jgi:hypothetical protein
MRVRVLRVDNQRRLRLARKLGRLGWPRWAIRRACRLSPRAVERALREESRGLWGRYSEAVHQEMRRSKWA